jgi:hypothetical protein
MTQIPVGLELDRLVAEKVMKISERSATTVIDREHCKIAERDRFLDEPWLVLKPDVFLDWYRYAMRGDTEQAWRVIIAGARCGKVAIEVHITGDTVVSALEAAGRVPEGVP